MQAVVRFERVPGGHRVTVMYKLFRAIVSLE